ncbi:relaxin-3-like [Carassius gibelio]|uniref:relaxin-3-like n=1 Tax=Carassius gibelio TaxID=101364 RepID=UPI0022783B19|nr:relaxin-3-like [Carassius gibelio]
MYGREFIRAVIFTCGGSRWRRSLDVSGDLSSDLLSVQDPIVPGLSYRPRPDAEAHVWTGEGPEDPVFISEEVLEASPSSDRFSCVKSRRIPRRAIRYREPTAISA